MKKLVKLSLRRLVYFSIMLLRRNYIGRYVYAYIINDAMNRTQSIIHDSLNLTFSVPNTLNKYRVDTFSTKEPETLEWIDTIPEGSVVWDIGANIGLYSCYAAKKRNCRVFAFEPSVFNLELLARNIFLNELAEKITIIPLPLSETLTISKLHMTNTEWGGALSTFGEDYGHDGRPMAKVFEFSTVGLSMVDAFTLLKLPLPDYVKMDVDGIEHLILKGGKAALQHAKGILIEINDKFIEQSDDASRCLKEVGFRLKEKRHADFFDLQTGSGSHTYNQIWVR